MPLRCDRGDQVDGRMGFVVMCVDLTKECGHEGTWWANGRMREKHRFGGMEYRTRYDGPLPMRSDDYDDPSLYCTFLSFRSLSNSILA